jgi:hypothetical protein
MTVATYLVVQSSKQNITTSFKYQPTAGCPRCAGLEQSD